MYCKATYSGLDTLFERNLVINFNLLDESESLGKALSLLKLCAFLCLSYDKLQSFSDSETVGLFLS